MSDEDGETLDFVTDEAAAGQRLDRWLSAQLPDLSRTRLQALIEAGALTIGDAPWTTASRQLKADEAISLLLPPPVDDTIRPEDIPLDIVYEDDDLLVINKPAGLVVHPAPGHYSGTLVNALLFHCGDTLSGIGGVRRPGIVHRLDKDTSGLMLVAKNDQAHAALSAQLADRSLSRRYRALVWGVPTPRAGRVSAPIGRHPAQRLKMAANVRGGREAATRYEMIETFGETAAMLECKLETGRTHQIRVHMQLLGHALVGDPLYGEQATKVASRLRRGGYEEAAQSSVSGFSRQALHARQISFIHPATDDEMIFEVEMPEDMVTLKDALSQ